MTLIEEKFLPLQRRRRKAFIPYVTAGDPSIGHTRELLEVLAECGADLIEIGVPFSDPLADGPIIQRASQRALASGATLQAILATVADFRTGKGLSVQSERGEHPQEFRREELPLILFSYLNPVWQMGIEHFARLAKESGIDGVLLTDLTPEEAPPIQEVLRKEGLDLIFLIAPTSTDERIKKISNLATGFIYAVSRTGTTGTRESLSTDLEMLVSRIRKHSQLPIAVGFGISRPEHVQAVWQVAEGAVVGSALVKVVEESIEAAEKGLLQGRPWTQPVRNFVRSLVVR